MQAEALAQEQRRKKRWALGAGGFLLLAVALGFLAVGPIKREWMRYSLTVDMAGAWTTIPTPDQFQMGCVPQDKQCSENEEPRHWVKLPNTFKLMQHNVSVAQFRRFTEATGRRLSRQPEKSKPDSPVVNVDWDDARDFCRFVGVVSGRLPTEAEWEYAARELKLGDMVGVVMQWTSTSYGRYPYRPGRENATSPEALVVRGGSLDDTGSLRVSVRNAFSPADRNRNVGFRCARDISDVLD